MILQRNIIYLLLFICIMSLFGLLSPWPTLVNVCAGLFAGATIGILTSVTQYYKIRKEYFVNLFVLLKDFYKVFVVDEELLCEFITYLREHDFDEITSCEGFKDFDEVNNGFVDRYSNLPFTCNHTEYISLNPFNKKTINLLERLDHEIWFTRGELIKFHSELLNVTESQSLEDIDDFICSRTLAYEALASGIQRIYSYAESICQRMKLMHTKEYQEFIYYADDAYIAVEGNEEYILYGNLLDENEDDELEIQ